MNGTKKQILTNVFLTLLFTAIGIGLLVGGAILKKGNDRKLAEWTQIDGTVVSYVTRNDDDGVMYSEVVEYEVNGVKYKITSSSSSNVRPTIGKAKKIAYNPVDPQESIIVSDNAFGNTLMFIVGGVFTAVGVLMAVTVVLKLIKGKKATAEATPEQSFYAGRQSPDDTGNGAPYTEGAYTPPAEVPQPNNESPFDEFDSGNRR